MIERTCIICGSKFMGRANATLCSGPCRLEYKRRYSREYKKMNYESIRSYQKQWRECGSKKGKEDTEKEHKRPEEGIKGKVMENIKDEKAKAERRKSAPDIYRASKWGRIYWEAERLDRIVMLSTAIAKYNIDKMTYGYLSAIYESGRYMTMLYKVLQIKAAERRMIYEAHSQGYEVGCSSGKEGANNVQG